MRKKLLWLMIATLPLTLTACGCDGKESSNNASDKAQSESEVSDKAQSESEVSDFDYGTVELCEYKGLNLEKPVYEITEESINYEIENLLYDYTEYKEVDRASKEGDYLNLSLTASAGDEVIYDYSGTDEESYDLNIGSEDFGAEVDEKLTGVKTGDKLSFTVKYDDDFEDADLAGNDVTYDITVNTVEEEIVPELTESFIKDTLGYDSEEDMNKQIRESLAVSNEETSNEALRENAITAVIDGSKFTSYSDELYEACEQSYDESYSTYMDWFGYDSLEELYEAFGITEEIKNNDILTMVYRMIAVDAIAKAEKITVSDEEYKDALEEYASYYEYDSTDDLLADYDEDSIHQWALEDKVTDLIIENATVTEVVTSDSEIEE